MNPATYVRLVIVIALGACALVSSTPRAEDSDQSILVLPHAWSSTRSQPLPPVPPPLVKPKLPASFIGCWVGDPGHFDRVYELSNISFQVGEPGPIEFCYYAEQITIPQAEVRISLANRALDFLSNLALSFDTFSAYSTNTDIYSLTTGEIRARTWLDIEETGHFLFVVPYHASSQSSVVDWDAKLAAPNICIVNALQLVTMGQTSLFTATWHGAFRRSNAER